MDFNEWWQFSNLVLEVVKSFFGQGVIQQNKKMLVIIQGLEKILKEIDWYVFYFVVIKVVDLVFCLLLQFLEYGLVVWMLIFVDQNEEGFQLVIRICKKNFIVWCDLLKFSGFVKK